tara:strand:- start:7627 stop:8346 length:720 start_codon:yes stop_codon:yes gene_type:complete
MNNNEFWSSELPPGYYDEILDSGLKKRRGFRANWHNITFSYISNYVNDNFNHLDYACGPGTFIGKYTKAISTGVDLSNLQINYAKEKYSKKGNFYIKNDFNLSDYHNYFDVITVIGLIEFLNTKDSKNLLISLKDCLKPGGKIILTTPNYGLSFKVLQKISNILTKKNYQEVLETKYTKAKINDLDLSSNFANYNVKKILNIGIIFSILNLNLGKKIEQLVSNVTNFNFGFLFLIELET